MCFSSPQSLELPKFEASKVPTAVIAELHLSEADVDPSPAWSVVARVDG